MASYEYEDLLGGDAPPANPAAVDPLAQALAALKRLAQPAQAPEAVVGADLMTPPGVQVPDRLASEGLSVGAGAPVAPTGTERPAEYQVGIDRFGAERGTPDVTGTAGFDPSATQYTPPTAPTGVDDATRQVNAQLSRAAAAQEAYGQAKLKADADHANRTAQAHEDAAQEQLLLGVRNDRAMEMINARADAETAAMLTELSNKAKEEPNPGRWWDDMGGLGKALWGLSLVFGAGYAAITPGARNAALDMVRQEISNDVARQEARLKREMDVLERKGRSMEKRHDRNLSDQRSKYEREYSRIMALERAWLARAVAPGDMDAEAAKAQSQAFFEEKKLGLVSGYRDEKVQAAAQAAARAHASAMQVASQRFQANQAALERQARADEKALDRQLQRDLAPVSLSAGMTGPGSQRNPLGKDGKPMYRELQSGVKSGRGVVLMDEKTGQPTGGDGVFFAADDKSFQDANETVEKANTRYTSLVKLKNLLEQEGSMGEALGVGIINPALQAEIQAIGYEIAKSHDARVTNQDFSKGVEQALGFDANGSFLDRTKFVMNRKEIIEKIDADLKAMPARVTESLQKYNDGSVNGQGQRPVWNPKYLQAPEEQVRGQNAVEGKPNLDLNQEKEPLTIKSYRERAGEEMKDPQKAGQLLPDHDSKQVQAVLEGVKGRGVDGVKAEAARVLKSVESRLEELHTRTEGPGFGPGEELTPERRQEMERLTNTHRIVSALERDAVEQAAEKVRKVEATLKQLKNIERAAGKKWVTPEVMRNKAKEMGLDRAPAEVEAIIKKLDK